MTRIYKLIDTMETIDVRTPTEKAREEKHRAICRAYLGLSNQHPECRPHRLMAIVAKQYGMTVPGIKNVLASRGLYEGAR